MAKNLNTITKDDFLRRCCENCEADLTRAQMSDAYDAMLQTVKEAVENQEGVTLHGIGTLYADIKPAHEARNPSTGEVVDVPDRLMLKFNVNTNFKLALREVNLNKKKGGKKEDKKGGRRR